MILLTLFSNYDIILYTSGHATFKFTKLRPESFLKKTKKFSATQDIPRHFSLYVHHHFLQQPATGPYPLSTSSVSSIKHSLLKIHFHIILPHPSNPPYCSLPFRALSDSPVVTTNTSVFRSVTSLLTPYTMKYEQYNHLMPTDTRLHGVISQKTIRAFC
jgi:hypothetical protein